MVRNQQSFFFFYTLTLIIYLIFMVAFYFGRLSTPSGGHCTRGGARLAGNRRFAEAPRA